jgi:hypothetical protein
MGQGGYLKITNSTPHKMVRISQSSHQMKSWNFDEVILPNESKTTYIEWDQGIFTHLENDEGDVEYKLEGTGARLHFCARPYFFEGFNLYVRLENIFMNNRRMLDVRGNVLDLGWKHNGQLNFHVAGSKFEYFVVTDALDRYDFLNPNQFLESRNGKFKLILQEDGDLVLYGPENRRMWASDTKGKLNTILKHNSGSQGFYLLNTIHKTVSWQIAIGGKNDYGNILVLQDDGNLVLYNLISYDKRGKPIWATNTVVM